MMIIAASKEELKEIMARLCFISEEYGFLIFPIAMYGSETWTLKEGDKQRISVLEMWVYRRMLRIPRGACPPNKHEHVEDDLRDV